MNTMVYQGFGCDAVLDLDAGTVTLTHAGKLVQQHKKLSSPWVIPLGAITEVQYKEKSVLARGWVRFILTDRVGWARDQIEDVNAFFAGKRKVGEFVAAIESARAGVPPVAMTTAPAQSTLAKMKTRDFLKAAPPPFPLSEPGWYPGPDDPGLLRYWDGASWTEHTNPGT